jgi:hypothetical protein
MELTFRYSNSGSRTSRTKKRRVVCQAVRTPSRTADLERRRCKTAGLRPPSRSIDQGSDFRSGRSVSTSQPRRNRSFRSADAATGKVTAMTRYRKPDDPRLQVVLNLAGHSGFCHCIVAADRRMMGALATACTHKSRAADKVDEFAPPHDPPFRRDAGDVASRLPA